jgi:hypothetical protein
MQRRRDSGGRGKQGTQTGITPSNTRDDDFHKNKSLKNVHATRNKKQGGKNKTLYLSMKENL